MPKKRTVFFGAGERGKVAVDYAKNNAIKVDFLVDNDPSKWGEIYGGNVAVYSPQHLQEIYGDLEVILTLSPRFENQVIVQLEEMGFRYGENVFKCIDKIDTDGFLNENFAKYEPIFKGFCGTRKYYVESRSGCKYFILFFDLYQIEEMKIRFGLIKKIASHDILMTKPIDFGCVAWGGYFVLSWIDGENLADVLNRVSGKEQYELGISAGKTLKKIHSVPDCPAKTVPVYFNSDEATRQFHEFGIELTKAHDYLISHIEEKLHLTEARPSSFIHADYQTPNMIYENGKVVIVDFNGCWFRDPWGDFTGALGWGKPSIFSEGVVYGYFNGIPDKKFWDVVTFYSAFDTIRGTLYRAVLAPWQLEMQMQRAANVTEWIKSVQY